MIWMRLQRTSASVKNAFGLNVGFVGLFLRGKYANVDAPFADGYSRPPFLFAGGDAKDARVAVSFGWPDVVPAIFKTPNIAQTRGCKIGSSHDAVPSQSGQRPASVGSTVLASLF